MIRAAAFFSAFSILTVMTAMSQEALPEISGQPSIAQPTGPGSRQIIWPSTREPSMPSDYLPATQGGAKAALSFSDQPFSEAELLSGKRIAEAECTAQSSSVWVTVGKTGECIAYYHATPNKAASDPNVSRSAVVFLTSDVVTVNARGEAKAVAQYATLTPRRLQAESTIWSNSLSRPYLMIARPGTFGSSGHHADRRAEREIEVVSAALDAIKARHNYERLHLAGYAEGAHTAAMLMTRRNDLGCVVLASGLLSMKQYLAEHTRTTDWTGNKKPLDPAETRDKIVRDAGLQVWVMTDPDDLVISARSQTAYVRRMNSLPVRQVFSAAPDPGAHGLLNRARQMTGDCASGMQEAALRKKYEDKVPDQAPDADDPPLHHPDTLRRDVAVTEAQCAALKTALWLTVDKRQLCIRYWMSSAGGSRSEPIVFFDGDLGSNDNGRLALNVAAARITNGQLQRMANLWSRNYGGTYVQLASVGTFGSSGSHTKDRATAFEVRVAMAAVDALKVKHGWTRIHVAGQSGGGHTAASLARQRDDIGCAVMASGGIALKLAHSYRGAMLGSNITSRYDPYDRLTDKPFPPHLRMVVVSDPADRIVPYSSQAAFVTLARLQNVRVVHLLTDASDKDHHGLSMTGIRAAADCAKGASDQQLVRTYHNTTARTARY